MITGIVLIIQMIIPSTMVNAAITGVNVGSQTGTLTAGVAGSATYTVSVSYTNGSSYGCYSGLAYSVTNYLPSAPTGVTSSWSGYPTGAFVCCRTNPYSGEVWTTSGNLTGVTLTINTTSATPAGTYTFQVNYCRIF